MGGLSCESIFLAPVDRPIIWQGLDATLIVNALVIGIKDFA